jgi:hypothetical protein
MRPSLALWPIIEALLSCCYGKIRSKNSRRFILSLVAPFHGVFGDQVSRGLLQDQKSSVPFLIFTDKIRILASQMPIHFLSVSASRFREWSNSLKGMNVLVHSDGMIDLIVSIQWTPAGMLSLPT